MPNLEDYAANVKRALMASEIYFKEHQVDYATLKTVGYYNRVLNHNVLLLYNGDMSETEFVDDLAGLIDKQFRRAWREGAKDVGFDPDKMSAAEKKMIEDRILKEYDYVDKFAADILQAAKDGKDIKPFQDRVNMWSNRYLEVQNDAHIQFSKDTGQLFEWQLGATEDHCDTCATLNGTVATADEWSKSGWKPQGSNLECGGWRCDCRLEPTDKEKTAGGIVVTKGWVTINGNHILIDGEEDGFINSIADSKTEIGGIFDKDGKLIARYDTGLAHNVSIPDDAIDKLKDNEFIHNHPNNMTFSDDDIRFGIRYEVNRMVVVDKEHIYTLDFDRTRSGYNASNIPEWSVDSLDRYVNDAFGKYSDAFYRGEITLQKANEEAAHEGIIKWINGHGNDFKNSISYRREKR